MKYKCPCCGYYTMDNEEPLYYDICPVCFWENDPIQNERPDYEGGANVMSLNTAQETFLKIGAVSEELIRYVRKPLPEEIGHEFHKTDA